MKKIIYRTLLFLVLISLVNSCTNRYDLIDSRPSITKFILDKQQINWNETYNKTKGKFSAPDSLHKKITFIDTIAIIKPVINVEEVSNSNWDYKQEMLDAYITQDIHRNIGAEFNYELDWYSFIHKFFHTVSPHYIPSISEGDYQIIKTEVSLMERNLDYNASTEYKMNDDLYNILAKYPANYYILFSLKERYTQTFYYGKYFKKNYANDFRRIRVFIFNKATRKIAFYNKIYDESMNHDYFSSLSNNKLMWKFSEVVSHNYFPGQMLFNIKERYPFFNYK